MPKHLDPRAILSGLLKLVEVLVPSIMQEEVLILLANLWESIRRQGGVHYTLHHPPFIQKVKEEQQEELSKSP